MKRKTKITISALAVMFVAAVAVAIASFSFAGNGNDLLEDSELVADASGSVSEKTMIDYIIENSYSQDDTEVDSVYHIAEITSSTLKDTSGVLTPNASTLKTYIENSGFKDYVIDGNKTIEQLMVADKIEYKVFNSRILEANKSTEKGLAEYNEALKYLSNADFIYVSNDAKEPFSKTNDLSEDIYDVLHSYAVGDYKPLVIDGLGSTSADTDEKTMADLAKSVFGPNEMYYYTFSWPAGISAQEYLSHTKGSLYLGINGKKQSDNGIWSKVYPSEVQFEEVKQDGTDIVIDKKIVSPEPAGDLAKVLTIGTSESDNAKTKALLGIGDNAQCTEVTTSLYGVRGTGLDQSSVQLIPSQDANQKYYKLEAGSTFRALAYNKRSKTYPDYIRNDFVQLSGDENDLLSKDFDEYDMIVIEDGCIGQSISNELYRKFASAMYGKIHIVYDVSMGTGQKQVDDATNRRETNYLDLYYMVAETNGVSKYDNVMITTRSDFSIITTSASAKTAKVIADLINSSKYRGMGGSDSAASMFTVLELQPCYPIDLDLAKSNGGNTLEATGTYYNHPESVVNGLTKEQIKEGTEYYKWELSRAKIADALNIPYNKINLVQMSTEEFAGNKSEVLGNYDLIYIGANTSALHENLSQYNFLQGTSGSLRYKLGSFNNNLNSFFNTMVYYPLYSVYAHNSDLVVLSSPPNENFGGGSNLSATVYKNGSSVGQENTFTMLNGNDITYNRYLALKEYIDAGMPVVISKDLTSDYNMVKNAKDKDGKANMYLQNSIDPDSNMFKVLEACKSQTDKAKTASSATVVWNFDQNAVVDIFCDADGSLGDSLTGYVSVFASSNQTASEKEKDADGNPVMVTGTKELLAQVYKNASKRPKLMVKSMPKTYNRFDSSTRLTTRELKFKYDVINSKNYTATLYYDADGNSKFDKSEDSAERLTSSSTGELTYDFSHTDFYGPLYWMLEIVDSNGVSVSQTGFSYIKNPDDKKQQVSVLQIMPENGGTQTGKDSLYFCTTCQRSINILKYNPFHDRDSVSMNQFTSYYNGYFKDTTNGYVKGKYYIGKHEHTFGVNSYDSNLQLEGRGAGVDNFYVNLADEIDDLYDFDIDIIRRKEFEEWSKQVRDAYEYVVQDDGTIDYSSKITDLSVSGNRAKLQNIVTQGPDQTASNYSDFTDLKKSLIDAAVAGKKAQDNTFDETTLTSLQQVQLLSDDALLALYVQNQKCTYTAKAAEYKAAYETQKLEMEKRTEEVDEAFKELKNMYGSLPGNLRGQTTETEWKSDIQNILDSGYYFDYYGLAKGFTRDSGNQITLSTGKKVSDLLTDYYKANDIKIDNKTLYKFYTRLAAGTGKTSIGAPGQGWIEACYSSVLLGPAESFAGDDIKSEDALDDLEIYVQRDNQIVLFHDTLTPFTEGTAGAVNLTARLRSYFGMDRNHMLTTVEAAQKESIENAAVQKATQYADSNNLSASEKAKMIAEAKKYAYSHTNAHPQISNTDSYYVKYVSSDPDKYFMTNLSYLTDKDKDGNAYDKYKNLSSDLSKDKTGIDLKVEKYLTDVAYTDSFNVGADVRNNRAMPYRYAILNYSQTTTQIQDTQFDMNGVGGYGTNKASQNNSGYVTTFPYTIASELNIGPTHGQAYALDLEDDDMTVWYSLAAGGIVNNNKDTASLFAASPRDAMDNYFLYSYGNVFYCGAGHSDILGYLKDNNDERYLFINIMCNSVRQTLDQPQINIYDYNTDKNEKIKKGDDGYYVTSVDSDTTYPDFSMRVTLDKEATIQNVKIFYDLDYNTKKTNAYTADGKHVLVANWNASNVPTATIRDVFRYDSDLIKKAKLDGDGNPIPVKDTSGNPMKDANGNGIYEYVTEKEMKLDGTTGTEDKAVTMLKLDPSYFEPYNNEYTYLVIQVTDNANNVTYQRIKIKLKPHLFDLT